MHGSKREFIDPDALYLPAVQQSLRPNPPNADITSFLSDGIQTFGLASVFLTQKA